MSIDSFGYEVMSLRELIAELGAQGEADPLLLDAPVWIENLPPLKWPVVKTRRTTAGVGLVVERGGN